MGVRISKSTLEYIDKNKKRHKPSQSVLDKIRDRNKNRYNIGESKMDKCSFCGSSDVKNFLTGQGDALICEHCIDIGRKYFDENKSNSYKKGMKKIFLVSAPLDKCSFCGSDVELFLTGQGCDAFICESCIDIGREYFDGNKSNNVQIDITPKSIKRQLDMTPKSIKKELDEYVIGQECPKKVLSVAIYNHMVKIKNNLDIQKGNILLIGPTGSGKTLLAQTLAKILDVPFAMADATTLTEAGYIGEDIETVLQPLLQRCDFDVEKTAKGIIFIDEIDKKGDNNVGNPSTTTRGVSSTGVQYGLLKLIEGTTANVHPIGTRKHPHQQCIQVDTSNILFIFGGAFNGLPDIISNRIGKNEVGFSEKNKSSKSIRNSELLKYVEQDDLIKFGLIPELVGRIPILTVLDELNISDLCRILTEPKGNLIEQYKTLLSCDGITIDFPDKTINDIAKIAFEKKIGARGLKTVIENIMLDFMFDIDRNNGGEITIEI